MMGNKFNTAKVSLQVIGLATAYAAGLGWLERQWPAIKPDHIWSEVAGGVLISLLPVVIEARTSHPAHDEQKLDWQTYERAVWTAFMSSGVPIILWQIGEAIYRQKTVQHYSSEVCNADINHLLEQVRETVGRNPAFAHLLLGVLRDRLQAQQS